MARVCNAFNGLIELNGVGWLVLMLPAYQRVRDVLHAILILICEAGYLWRRADQNQFGMRCSHFSRAHQDSGHKRFVRAMNIVREASTGSG